MELISASQKISLQSPFRDLHDTFKRKIRAFKEGKKVVINANPDFNHVYNKASALSKYEKVEREIDARVYYQPKAPDKKNLNVSSDNLNLLMSTIDVRLKVLKEDFDFLIDSERIELDGKVFRILSTERPVGLFNGEFFIINLQKLD